MFEGGERGGERRGGKERNKKKNLPLPTDVNDNLKPLGDTNEEDEEEEEALLYSIIILLAEDLMGTTCSLLQTYPSMTFGFFKDARI